MLAELHDLKARLGVRKAAKFGSKLRGGKQELKVLANWKEVCFVFSILKKKTHNLRVIHRQRPQEE